MNPNREYLKEHTEVIRAQSEGKHDEARFRQAVIDTGLFDFKETHNGCLAASDRHWVVEGITMQDFYRKLTGMMR